MESGGFGKDGKGATNGSGAQHGSVSGPLESLAPARSKAEGRGAAQLKNLTVSGFETGVYSIVQDTGQKC